MTASPIDKTHLNIAVVNPTPRDTLELQELEKFENQEEQGVLSRCSVISNREIQKEPIEKVAAAISKISSQSLM